MRSAAAPARWIRRHSRKSTSDRSSRRQIAMMFKDFSDPSSSFRAWWRRRRSSSSRSGDGVDGLNPGVMNELAPGIAGRGVRRDRKRRTLIQLPRAMITPASASRQPPEAVKQPTERDNVDGSRRQQSPASSIAASTPASSSVANCGPLSEVMIRSSNTSTASTGENVGDSGASPMMIGQPQKSAAEHSDRSRKAAWPARRTLSRSSAPRAVIVAVLPLLRFAAAPETSSRATTIDAEARLGICARGTRRASPVATPATARRSRRPRSPVVSSPKIVLPPNGPPSHLARQRFTARNCRRSARSACSVTASARQAVVSRPSDDLTTFAWTDH